MSGNKAMAAPFDVRQSTAACAAQAKDAGGQIEFVQAREKLGLSRLPRQAR
jgi:hypothetical protein